MMQEIITVFLNDRAGQVLTVLATMAFLGIALFVLGVVAFILFEIKRSFRTFRRENAAAAMVFWGIVLTLIRLFGQWCAGL